jgi:hypothetical protein
MSSNILSVSMGSYSDPLMLNRNPFLLKYSNSEAVSPGLIDMRDPSRFFSTRVPFSPNRTNPTPAEKAN